MNQKIFSPGSIAGKVVLRTDKLSVIFAFLALGTGVAISIAVNQLGWLALGAVVGMLMMITTVSSPNLGIMALFFIVFAQVQRVVSEVNGLPGPGKPLVLFLMLILAIRYFVFNERPENWLRNSIIFIVYAISLFISVVTADNTDVAITEFGDVIQNLIIASMVLYFVQDSVSLKSAILTIIVSGIFMSSISIFQNLTHTYSNNYWGFGGWEYSGYVGRPRMTGPYETPNPYAQVLVVIFVLALDRMWHESRLSYRLLGLLGSGLCALAIIYTDSRGGFINLVFTIGIFFLFNRPSILSLLISFTIGLALVQFLPSNFTDRLSTLAELNPFRDDTTPIVDESFRGRTSENIAAWRMFLDNPIFGVGLENYAEYYQDYSRQIGLDPRSEARDPASLYLQLLANQGLVGTTIFFVLIILIFVRLWKTYQTLKLAEMHDEADMSSALFAALAGYMFMSIYKNSANTNVFWLLIALCLATSQLPVNISAKNAISGQKVNS